MPSHKRSGHRVRTAYLVARYVCGCAIIMLLPVGFVLVDRTAAQHTSGVRPGVPEGRLYTRSNVATTPTNTPSASPTVSPGETVDPTLPDLTIIAMQISLESGGACDYSSTNLGLRVYIKNIGMGAAGPFTVEANGVSEDVAAGLKAGETTSLWFEGYVYPGENTAMVDSTNLVPESDETNNRLTQFVPIPTLPPPCTATPTGTAPTATPTGTRATATPTEQSIMERLYLPLVTNAAPPVDSTSTSE